MQLRNSENQYGTIAKLLHWVVALLIIFLLILGNVMGDITGPDKFKAYGIHKSVGMIVLFLVFIRFTWRQANVQPKLPKEYPWWMDVASKLTHAMIYLLMFSMPISGWLMSSAAGFPVSVFGWFTMPDLISASKDMRELMGEIHEWASNLLILLLCMHIAAALFHHFKLKDDILKRMLPSCCRKKD